jgi:hypothetical protein
MTNPSLLHSVATPVATPVTTSPRTTTNHRLPQYPRFDVSVPTSDLRKLFLHYLASFAPHLSVRFSGAGNTTANSAANTDLDPTTPTLALLFATEFGTPYLELNEFERTYRSSLVDLRSGAVLFAVPALDVDNMMDITSGEINGDRLSIQESFEGTTVTLYQPTGSDRWLIATRKHQDAMNSYWRSRRSFGEQVVATIERQTGATFADFVATLDRTMAYTYVLSSYQTRSCIDYSDRFGTDYSVLHLRHAWDRTRGRVVFGDELDSGAGVFAPDSYKGLSHLATVNRAEQAVQSVCELTLEGVLVFNHRTGKMSKIHTDAYRVFTETSDYRDHPGSPMHLIRIYQQHGMDAFSLRFPSDMVFTSSSGSKLNTKGLIDIMFKLLTAELFGLFRAMGQRYTTRDDVARSTACVVAQLFALAPELAKYREMFARIRTAYHAVTAPTLSIAPTLSASSESSAPTSALSSAPTSATSATTSATTSAPPPGFRWINGAGQANAAWSAATTATTATTAPPVGPRNWERGRRFESAPPGAHSGAQHSAAQHSAAQHSAAPGAPNGTGFTSKHVLDIVKRTDVADLLRLWNERSALMRFVASEQYAKVLVPVIASIHTRINVTNLVPMAKFVDEFVARANGIEQSADQFASV